MLYLVSRYPLPLPSARHCLILEGFNSSVVEAIQELEAAESNVVDTAAPAAASPSLSPIGKKRRKRTEEEEPLLITLDNEDREVGESEPLVISLLEEDHGREEQQPQVISLVEEEELDNHGNKSQEELDHELAVRLSREINEDQEVNKSDQVEDDYDLAVRLNAQEYAEVIKKRYLFPYQPLDFFSIYSFPRCRAPRSPMTTTTIP